MCFSTHSFVVYAGCLDLDVQQPSVWPGNSLQCYDNPCWDKTHYVLESIRILTYAKRYRDTMSLAAALGCFPEDIPPEYVAILVPPPSAPLSAFPPVFPWDGQSGGTCPGGLSIHVLPGECGLPECKNTVFKRTFWMLQQLQQGALLNNLTVASDVSMADVISTITSMMDLGEDFVGEDHEDDFHFRDTYMSDALIEWVARQREESHDTDDDDGQTSSEFDDGASDVTVIMARPTTDDDVPGGEDAGDGDEEDDHVGDDNYDGNGDDYGNEDYFDAESVYSESGETFLSWGSSPEPFEDDDFGYDMVKQSLTVSKWIVLIESYSRSLTQGTAKVCGTC